MSADTQQPDPRLDNVRIFGGSAHPELTAETAAYLGLQVSPMFSDKFSNDNLEVQLGVSVRQKDVFIIQPIVPPSSDNLMEMLMMLDIARMSGARSITAVLSHYSYGRSDKKDAPRISITARLVADLMTTAGAQRFITMTLHSPQVHGFFNVPTDHLTAHSVFVNYFKEQDLSNTVVVSPDIGNAKRAEKLAEELDLPLAIGQKKRQSDTSVNIGTVLGDIEGKRVIVFDDEIATGGTTVEIIERLKLLGAKTFMVACTHGLFMKNAAERLDPIPEVEAIISTNSVPVPPERRPKKLVTLSVGHIIGEVIRRSIVGESVGELFAFWPTSTSGRY